MTIAYTIRIVIFFAVINLSLSYRNAALNFKTNKTVPAKLAYHRGSVYWERGDARLTRVL